jgi:hypothetical protein
MSTLPSEPLTRQLTVAELRSLVVNRGTEADPDHRVKFVIPVPAGALLGGDEQLGDYANECALPEEMPGPLYDLEYKVVGLDPEQYDENSVKGLLFVEVDAAIDLDDLDACEDAPADPISWDNVGAHILRTVSGAGEDPPPSPEAAPVSWNTDGAQTRRTACGAGEDPPPEPPAESGGEDADARTAE